MKATQLLRAQHCDAKKLLVALERGKSANTATGVKLVVALGAHMVIEQEIFYPAVKAIDPRWSAGDDGVAAEDAAR
jgi:hypothetical protein